MRILYHSAAPWVSTGYGTCTEEIAGRLHNAGHEVAIQTMSAVKKGDLWYHGEDLSYELDEPMRVYAAEGPYGLGSVEENFRKFDADVLFTHFDTWMEVARNKIPEMEIPYISYVIVDHDPAPKAVVEQVNNAVETVAMSKFADNKLSERGIRPVTIPHGVDTDTFKPIKEDDETPSTIRMRDEDGNEFERDLEEPFIFGMVAANHGDRKNIPNHLEAFKMFLEKVDEDAILYVHTEQNTREGYNLGEVMNEISIPKRNIIWPRAEDYGSVSQSYLNKWYNVFDVMLNCSFGESWGLTITEAMAAGTPAIVSNFSSMPEQLGVDVKDGSDVIHWVSEKGYHPHTVGVAPHGLVVEPDANIWRERVSSRQCIVDADSIYQAMKYYYEKPAMIEAHGNLARAHVMENYDWEDCVVSQFDSLFATLEGVIN